MRRFVRVMDTTLRDGSHAVAHQFTPAQVAQIAGGLDEAGVEVIEVSHGDGLGGSSIQYGRSAYPEAELLATAQRAITRGKLAVLHLPGIGIKDDLELAAEHGAKVARICTHCTEADICEQHIKTAKRLGMEAVAFLMMAHMIEPKQLTEQAMLMESFGADVVVIADSAGAMLPDEVRARVAALREAVDCQIGLHAHNNLGLSVANSLAAIEEGAVCVDGATCGLGAGAGNTPTEVLVAVLHKLGYDTGINLYTLMDVAERMVRPVLPRPIVIDRSSLCLGYFGVYSSFLLHAERAAQRFGIDMRDILAELGRRRVVGGQEDMIVDVAVDLSERAQSGGSSAQTRMQIAAE